MSIRVDLYKFDLLTGVTLTKAEQTFKSSSDFNTSWAEMKTQDWSHIFITQNAERFDDDKLNSMKKLLLSFRGGEA